MPLNLTPFDPAAHLDTPELVELYLNEAMRSGHAGVIADAIGVCVKAFGYSEMARRTGLNRQNLYRSFSASGNPELGNVLKVAEALGVRLAVVNSASRDDATTERAVG